MKKANEEHPVYVSLRDWSKVRKANTAAEKTERKETLCTISTKKQ